MLICNIQSVLSPKFRENKSWQDLGFLHWRSVKYILRLLFFYHFWIILQQGGSDIYALIYPCINVFNAMLWVSGNIVSNVLSFIWFRWCISCAFPCIFFSIFHYHIFFCYNPVSFCVSLSSEVLQKSHNATVPNPTMHHFVTEICLYISDTKWYIMGYLLNASWDFVWWVWQQDHV